MADSAVSSLTASDTLTGAELFYADGFASSSAADVKVTALQLRAIARGTVTDNVFLLNDSITWNDAAETFTAWKLNVTNTNSAAASMLLDLRVGGTSQLNVNRTGDVLTLGYVQATTQFLINAGVGGDWRVNSSGVKLGSTTPLTWTQTTDSNDTRDLFLRRAAAANIALGTTDAAAPVAQTLSVQNVVAGTTDTAGADWTHTASLNTGTGAAGKFIFKTGAKASGTGSTQATATQVMAIGPHTQRASEDVPVLNLAQTWNDSGTTFTGIRSNITSTASGASSLLLDLQVGGTSKFKVDKTGRVVCNDILVYTMYDGAFSYQAVSFNGSNMLFGGANAPPFVFSPGNFASPNYTVEQRNSTNAQTHNIYNTYTDASNYERLEKTWSSNSFYIRTVKAGTGTDRAILIQASASLYLGGAAGTSHWVIGTGGGLAPTADASVDIGSSGATIKKIYTGPVVGTVQSLSGAGAVNLTTYTTAFTSTGGAQALTLADGVVGQIKHIIHISDGGSGVLTPTNLFNGSTITFTNLGDACVLQFLGTEWCVISLNGAVLG